MSNCTSGCHTQDHASYAECLRAKTTRVAYANSANGSDYSAQKRWDRDLDFYKSTRAQGIQPAGTNRSQVERAVEISNITGTAYQA